MRQTIPPIYLAIAAARLPSQIGLADPRQNSADGFGPSLRGIVVRNEMQTSFGGFFHWGGRFTTMTGRSKRHIKMSAANRSACSGESQTWNTSVCTFELQRDATFDLALLHCDLGELLHGRHGSNATIRSGVTKNGEAEGEDFQVQFGNAGLLIAQQNTGGPPAGAQAEAILR